MHQQVGLDLLQDEKVELTTKPHPLSFLRYHLFALYLIILASFLGWLYTYLQSDQQLLASLSLWDAIFGNLGIRAADAVLLFLFWVVLLVSGFAVGVLWVTKMPLVLMVLVGAAGTALELYFLAPFDIVLGLVQKPIVKLLLLGASAVTAMVFTEIYRRGHSYVITNYRIVMKKDFIQRKEREITYEKITDVYLDQGVLGRIFNFGTINLITASGFGLGADSAQALIAATVPMKETKVTGGFLGGKSVQMPRAATYFSLYGIPDPKKARVIIGNRQLETKESPILRRIEGLLEDKEK
jgi:membrane protein YdbS with pleckstrin-like domain